jgi:hypothetical protein
MKVHILASGSAGNATCIEMGGSRFLLDAGISARRLKQGLSEVGVVPEAAVAVLSTAHTPSGRQETTSTRARNNETSFFVMFLLLLHDEMGGLMFTTIYFTI